MIAQKASVVSALPKLTQGRIVRTEHGGEEVPAIVVKVHSETVVDLIAFTLAGAFPRAAVVLRGREGLSEDDLTWWWPEEILRQHASAIAHREHQRRAKRAPNAAEAKA